MRIRRSARSATCASRGALRAAGVIGCLALLVGCASNAAKSTDSRDEPMASGTPLPGAPATAVGDASGDATPANSLTDAPNTGAPTSPETRPSTEPGAEPTGPRPPAIDPTQSSEPTPTTEPGASHAPEPDASSAATDPSATDSGAGSTLAPDSSATSTTSVVIPSPPAGGYATLREAGAAVGKLIGTAIAATALDSDATYRDVAAREFDYVTPEDAMKWGPLQPNSGAHDWTAADAIVDFAEGNAQAVKGHTFAWYQQNPAWVTDATNATELEGLLESHIRETLRRYKGRVRAWDIVNEAVDTDSATGYRENLFYSKLGKDYIENAFRWAHDEDPDLLLFYNEIAAERLGPKSDFLYTMISDLLERGVPIDGVGFQSHVSTHRYPSESDLRANLKRFGELGLSVNISEVDVRDTLFPGSAETRALAQRIAYQQLTAACTLEPACEAITFWGFTDNYSWLLEEGDLNPLLFDRSYQKKPAYQGVLDGLLGKLPVRGANLLQNPDFAAGDEAWSARSGTLSVDITEGFDRYSACIDGRAANTDGLEQSGLLAQLPEGGPLAFSAWVFASSTSTVDATLSITESADPRAFNIATTLVQAGQWREVSGYLALGYDGTPTAVSLEIAGPEPDVTLCVADVHLGRVTP